MSIWDGAVIAYFSPDVVGRGPRQQSDKGRLDITPYQAIRFTRKVMESVIVALVVCHWRKWQGQVGKLLLKLALVRIQSVGGSAGGINGR